MAGGWDVTLRVIMGGALPCTRRSSEGDAERRGTCRRIHEVESQQKKKEKKKKIALAFTGDDDDDVIA
jgi:hypothetical protein